MHYHKLNRRIKL